MRNIWLSRLRPIIRNNNTKKLLQIYTIWKSSIHIYGSLTKEKHFKESLSIPHKNISQSNLQQDCEKWCQYCKFLSDSENQFFEVFILLQMFWMIFGNLWINKWYHNVASPICHRKTFMIMSKTTRVH